MRRTTLHRLALALAALGVVSLAACGGDDDAGGGGGGDAIKVGTEGTYSPFTFHDPATNELTGFDVEVVRAIGEKLGREVEFSETTFDAIFAGLEAGRFDVVANQISINPEREAKYSFSQPYTVSTGVVVTKSDDTTVSTLADVRGKTSAQSVTSNFAEIAEQAGAKLEPVEGLTQAVTLVKQGRADMTINDSLAVLDYLKTSGDKDIRIAAEVGDRTEQGFAFRKDSDLPAEFDRALDELRADGTLAEISEKYFGEDVSGE
jgi:L-cystine transport system substrate-binding protein